MKKMKGGSEKESIRKVMVEILNPENNLMHLI
jgi:hypothetical protein